MLQRTCCSSDHPMTYVDVALMQLPCAVSVVLCSFRASRRSDVSHVVITGFLDGGTVQGVSTCNTHSDMCCSGVVRVGDPAHQHLHAAQTCTNCMPAGDTPCTLPFLPMPSVCWCACMQILDELYHEDKGFNNNHAVFLSERPPSHDVEHALATHAAARKLSFLQGSPFRTEVGWSRAGQGHGRACGQLLQMLQAVISHLARGAVQGKRVGRGSGHCSSCWLWAVQVTNPCWCGRAGLAPHCSGVRVRCVHRRAKVSRGPDDSRPLPVDVCAVAGAVPSRCACGPGGEAGAHTQQGHALDEARHGGSCSYA